MVRHVTGEQRRRSRCIAARVRDLLSTCISKASCCSPSTRSRCLPTTMKSSWPTTSLTTSFSMRNLVLRRFCSTTTGGCRFRVVPRTTSRLVRK